MEASHCDVCENASTFFVCSPNTLFESKPPSRRVPDDGAHCVDHDIMLTLFSLSMPLFFPRLAKCGKVCQGSLAHESRSILHLAFPPKLFALAQ